jgi:hypothetical protein
MSTDETTTSEAPATEPRKMTYEELENAARELGQCTLWALKYLRADGSGLHFDLKTGVGQRWEDRFMDALDLVGYRLDREKFWESLRSKPKRGKRRAAGQEG